MKKCYKKNEQNINKYSDCCSKVGMDSKYLLDKFNLSNVVLSINLRECLKKNQ